MKFYFISFLYLLFIVTAVGINANDEPKSGQRATEREPLPLMYKTLLIALSDEKLKPDVIHAIKTNIELNEVYEILKDPVQLGLKPENAKALYDALSKLDLKRFKLFLDLIIEIKNNINLVPEFQNLLNRVKNYYEKSGWDVALAEKLYPKEVLGKLINSLVDLINKYAFDKEKISLKTFKDNYDVTDFLLWQPSDTAVHNKFMQFLKEFKIGDFREIEE